MSNDLDNDYDDSLLNGLSGMTIALKIESGPFVYVELDREDDLHDLLPPASPSTRPRGWSGHPAVTTNVNVLTTITLQDRTDPTNVDILNFFMGPAGVPAGLTPDPNATTATG